jgi:hypothetical protein
MSTEEQFDYALSECRQIFEKKLKDYGASWRLLRPQSITDQLFIKAKRIRQLETTGVNLVGDDIYSELMAIVNYGIVALIQLELGFADTTDISNEKALALYNKFAVEAKQLMMAKNHDYDEAWRGMRVTSYTDFILTKICRNKEIEDNDGKTLVSEGVDGNYFDMVNYAVFGLIKKNEEKNNKKYTAIAVALYILCPVPLILLGELDLGILGVCCLLIMVAIATMLLILSGKEEQEEVEKEEPEYASDLHRSIDRLIWTVGLASYFVISFLTGAWHITWLIFLISAAIDGIVRAIFDLKEAK